MPEPVFHWYQRLQPKYFASIKASFDNPAAPIATPTPLANETKKVTLPEITNSTPAVAAPIIKEREVINPVKPVQPPVKTETITPQAAQKPVSDTPAQKPASEPTDVAEITKEIQEIKTAEQTAGQTADKS